MPQTAVEPIDLWLPAVGIGLIGLCMTIHSFFLFAVLHSHARFSRLCPDLHGVWMLVPSVLLATALIAASCCIQIVLWALVLLSTGDFASFRDALYYSSTTYTTLGASHRVLHAPYRALEPLEATNGLLANGLNTAILFAVMSSLARRRSGYGDFFK